MGGDDNNNNSSKARSGAACRECFSRYVKYRGCRCFHWAPIRCCAKRDTELCRGYRAAEDTIVPGVCMCCEKGMKDDSGACRMCGVTLARLAVYPPKEALPRPPPAQHAEMHVDPMQCFFQDPAANAVQGDYGQWVYEQPPPPLPMTTARSSSRRDKGKARAALDTCRLPSERKGKGKEKEPLGHGFGFPMNDVIPTFDNATPQAAFPPDSIISSIVMPAPRPGLLMGTCPPTEGMHLFPDLSQPYYGPDGPCITGMSEPPFPGQFAGQSEQQWFGPPPPQFPQGWDPAFQH